MNISYDYVIVGGGPSGLTLAWLLANNFKNKKIIIIEREDTLGGCHRVRRHDGLFTEHGPRIYSDAYLNFQQILNDMNINFHKIFTKYNFGSGKISYNLISKMSFREMFYLIYAFIQLIINPNWGQKESVLKFAQRFNFSTRTIDELDRLCRLTDGAGADRYTIWELLSGFDQHIFYKFFQPRRPNDIYLFPMWKQKLEESGQVQFLMGTEVKKLKLNNNNIQGVSIQNAQGNFDINCKNVVLAIPPENISTLITRWGKYNMKQFNQFSQYMTYIPVTFHWNRKLKLPVIWGFPSTSWGILSLLSSDYTVFDDDRSKTVLSCCVSITDIPSEITGKTANQTRDKNELIGEIFRQISKVYGGLPEPTVSILSPGVYRHDGKWKTFDSSFILTPQGGYLPEFSHPEVNGLYMVGTHVGKSYYHFTALESAVTNAMVFFLEKYPSVQSKYQLQKPINLSKVLRFIIIMIIMLIIYYYRKNIIKLYKKILN